MVSQHQPGPGGQLAIWFFWGGWGACINSQVLIAAFGECRMALKRNAFNQMLWDAWVELCKGDPELQTMAMPSTPAGRKRPAESAGVDIVKHIQVSLQCKEITAHAHAVYDIYLRPLFVARTMDVDRLDTALHYWAPEARQVHSNTQLYPCVASVSVVVEYTASRRVTSQTHVALYNLCWFVAKLVFHLSRYGTRR